MSRRKGKIPNKLVSIKIELFDNDGNNFGVTFKDMAKPEVAIQQNPIIKATWDTWVAMLNAKPLGVA